MRKYSLFFFVFICIKGLAQLNTPDVIASGGGFTSSFQFSNSYTIGEISLVDTCNPGSYILTQGFQQANKKSVLADDDFFIPNGITPNGDGVNDVWEIPHLKNYPNCEVKIFNRWGQQVFANSGYTQFWDGTINGNMLPTADYYYVISVDKTGKKEHTGTITIKR